MAASMSVPAGILDDMLDRIGPSAARQREADDDAKLEEMRYRWKASVEESAHWQADVQNSMARWSLQRARIEEEITRRQEASRYSSPLPRFHSRTGQSRERLEVPSRPSVSAGFDAPVSPSVDSPFSSSSIAFDDAHDSPGTTRSLSPYSDIRQLRHPTPWGKSRPTSALSVVDRKSAGPDVEDLLEAFRRKGIPISSDVVRRALLIPDDKPFEDCTARLPQPGSNLLSSGAGSKKGGKKKGKKGKGGGKKKGSKSPKGKKK